MTSAEHGFGSLDENGRREYWAALALRCTKGLGARSVCSLLRHFGSAYEAYVSKSQWALAQVSIPQHMEEPAEAWRTRARPEWEAARRLDTAIILWTDPLYPSQLREIADAPALLYARGNLDLLKAPLVAVIGSRECSLAAADMASAVAGGLANMGITVVSGMAMGIDSFAHKAALRGSGKSLAVLGTGIDVAYPSCNTGLYRSLLRDGLILSELAPGCTARPGAFPVRNRIISGLSLGIFVAEAGSPKSGSLITARLAAENGRNVYVPSPEHFHGSYREGTRQLLMEGAQPVSSAEHIAADLFPQLLFHTRTETPQKKCPPELPGQKYIAQRIEYGNPAKYPEPSSEYPVLTKAPDEEAMQDITGNGSVFPMPQNMDTQPPARPVPLKERPILTMPKASSTPQTAEEEAVLDILKHRILSADDLLYEARDDNPRMNWTAASINAVLMVLEVKGLVRRMSDSRYEAKK